MMRPMTRILSIIIVLFMVFTLMACQDKSDIATDTTAKKDEVTDNKNEENPGETDEVKAEGDMDEVFEIMWIPFGVPPEEEGLYPQTYLENKFNVKIELIQIDPQARDQQLGIMFATGVIPDFIQHNLPRLYEYVNQGFVREIPVEMIKKHMPTFNKWTMEMDDKLFEYSSIQGKNYGLPMPNENGKYVAPMIWRTDWLKAIGYDKAPQTLEEYEDAFYKFRNEDPNKSGKKDTYALTNPSDSATQNWFTPIFGAYGAIPGMWMLKGNQVVNGFAEDGTLEAVKLLNKWYKDGIIDLEWVTDMSADRSGGPGDIATKFANGRIGFIYHFGTGEYKWYDEPIDVVAAEVTGRWQQYNQGWPDSSWDEVYTAGDAPKGPGGQGVTKGGMVGNYAMFGANVSEKKMIRLLQMCEAITTDPETYLTGIGGEEGVHREAHKTEHSPIGITYKWSQNAIDEMDGKAPKNLTKIGSSSYFTPWVHWNKNVRFLWYADVLYERAVLSEQIATGPGYESPIKVPLPSVSEYPDLNKIIDEFIMKAILGEVGDVDSAYQDAVNKWMKAGGEQLIKEANELYNQ